MYVFPVVALVAVVVVVDRVPFLSSCHFHSSFIGTVWLYNRRKETAPGPSVDPYHRFSVGRFSVSHHRLAAAVDPAASLPPPALVVS